MKSKKLNIYQLAFSLAVTFFLLFTLSSHLMNESSKLEASEIRSSLLNKRLLKDTSTQKRDPKYKEKYKSKSTKAKQTKANKLRWDNTQQMLLSVQENNLAVCVLDIRTGRIVGLHVDQPFYAASVAKLPIVLWTMELIHQGKISFETSFAYKDIVNDIPGAMQRNGTGSLQYQAVEGQEFTVRDLIQRTICESDNQASNMLSYYLGQKNAKAYQKFRQKFDPEAKLNFSKLMTARVAARYMAALSQEDELASDFQSTLWAGSKIGTLPYPVWHKIGVNGQYNHDAAYVPAIRPYVMVIMTKGWTDNAIATLAQRIDHILSET
ncbi:serine hydrolase [Atopobacter sp. AH10]|uniref:serine hydrolase n=1 Tax=Atopobacter sp. AH10 TaxID=2315861 RepID=UPI001314AC00|nr:serine hydrolase [Atopobacter sp. AH10]